MQKTVTTYIITLEAMGAIVQGTHDAMMIEEVYEYLSSEYPTYNVLSVIAVPRRIL